MREREEIAVPSFWLSLGLAGLALLHHMDGWAVEHRLTSITKDTQGLPVSSGTCTTMLQLLIHAVSPSRGHELNNLVLV